MVKKKNKGKKLLFAGIIIALIIIVIMLFNSSNSYDPSEVEAFAKCITDRGAVMYGAYWCPHCANVKKNFGEAFRYVNYVECDPRGENEQSLLCIQKGIDNYATFEFNNDSSTRLIGEPTFEEIAAATGCTAPQLK